MYFRVPKLSTSAIRVADAIFPQSDTLDHGWIQKTASYDERAHLDVAC